MWTIDIHTHQLIGGRFIESPNHDERPLGMAIDLLVIHNMSLPPGVFGGNAPIDLFCNVLDKGAHPFYETLEGVKVSAHVLIRRTGEIIQFVPFHKRAWHAGESLHQGRDKCNDFSIGIELEGTDDLPYEPEQYQSLIGLTRALREAYPTLKHIAGHSDIAPSRKTDPGSCFDWAYYKQHIG